MLLSGNKILFFFLLIWHDIDRFFPLVMCDGGATRPFKRDAGQDRLEGMF